MEKRNALLSILRDFLNDHQASEPVCVAMRGGVGYLVSTIDCSTANYYIPCPSVGFSEDGPCPQHIKGCRLPRQGNESEWTFL